MGSYSGASTITQKLPRRSSAGSGPGRGVKLASMEQWILVAEEDRMAVKVVALWSQPRDVEGFEKDYDGSHIALAAKLPGLKGAIASKALDGPDYRLAHLLFGDVDQLRAALRS